MKMHVYELYTTYPFFVNLNLHQIYIYFFFRLIQTKLEEDGTKYGLFPVLQPRFGSHSLCQQCAYRCRQGNRGMVRLSRF